MFTSSSVVFPRAERTATTRLPASFAATIFSAARLMRSASATEVPPNFMTTVWPRGEAASGTAIKDSFRRCLDSYAAVHPVAADDRAPPRGGGGRRGGHRRADPRGRWLLEAAERGGARAAQDRAAIVPLARDTAARRRAAGDRHPEPHRASRALAAARAEGGPDDGRRVLGRLAAGGRVRRARDGRRRHGARGVE